MSRLEHLRFVVRSARWWAVLGALVSGMLTASIGAYSMRQPSAYLIDAHELDGVAIKGGFIQLYAQVNRTRLCQTDVRRWLWRWIVLPDGSRVKEWVGLGTPASPPVPIGVDTYVLDLPVPDRIEPGDWFYLGVARDSCSWWPNALWRDPVRTTSDTPILIQAKDITP